MNTKNKFQKSDKTMNLKEKIFIVTVGVSAGIMAKQFIENNSKKPIRSLLRTVIIYGITNYISKHPKVIKRMGLDTINLIAGVKNFGRQRSLD